MTFLEMHTHTYPASDDSNLYASELLCECEHKGINVVVLTNHYDSYQLDRYSNGIEGWLEDIYVAKRLASTFNVKVLCGMEYSVGPLHINMLGVTTYLLEKTPPLPDMNLTYVLDYIKKHDLFGIVNHPLESVKTHGLPIDELLGYEIMNTRAHHISRGCCDARMLLADLVDTKPMIVASDVHRDVDVGRSIMATDMEINTEADLITMVKSGNYKVGVNYTKADIRTCELVSPKEIGKL